MFKTGDKVKKNSRGFTNGWVGTVIRISKTGAQCYVDFGGCVERYQNQDNGSLMGGTGSRINTTFITLAK